MNKIRCAIYTRKSSEEGLEQGFNSLDAQREACSAYVLSQANEGWQVIPEQYDDGGISGGTLERPALRQLLADINAGQVDIVVVYKVDRLTRSLFDFSKLIEIFDKAKVSFVSITQSFNTTTSMGRLTLNMLLSFAQFEREVTAERIRDKLAASKAKGMWMGGTPPLGYRPDGRSLAIVEEHAALVRKIYHEYLALGSVRVLADKLSAQNIHAPIRVTSTGKCFGGRRFSRGQLYFFLRNPIYVSDIPHKDKTYPGQHPAIIDRATWDKVQQTLTNHIQGSHQRCRARHKSLLIGLIVDARGEPMIATHAAKGTIRYRYYVSRSLHLKKGEHGTGQRLPAREIEGLVKEQVAKLFDDPLALVSQLRVEPSPALFRHISSRCEHLARDLRSRSGHPLADLIDQVRALSDALEIDLSARAIAETAGCTLNESCQTITLIAPYRLTRTGQALRLIQNDGTHFDTKVDPALIKLLVRARKWWSILCQGDLDIAELARREGVNDSYVTRIVRIAFLAPPIVDAILAGRQHHNLSAAIIRAGQLPACWQEQTRRFLPM